MRAASFDSTDVRLRKRDYAPLHSSGLMVIRIVGGLSRCIRFIRFMVTTDTIFGVIISDRCSLRQLNYFKAPTFLLCEFKQIIREAIRP